ncbi:MAG TPA: DUF1552 domain-containing protein [Steroidobacteraceae bacterium]|nr:DUF1552 domain-containing protein [Steroidobacteraceae bacterium]
MNIMREALNRRTLLRGLGTAMSLPLLDAMLPARAGDVAARPRRLQIFYTPNGMIMENYTPAKVGKDFPLSPTLQPFAPYKERMTVLTGLAHQETADGHAQGCAGFLTGVKPRATEGADLQCGISIDQVIGNHYADQTLLPTLELGIDVPSQLGSCVPAYSCAYTNTLSWRDESNPLPVTVNPRDVFERMFGDGDALDAASRVAQQRRRSSILDFVREDAARMAGKLGSNDRRKMDQYLSSVRDIERRIQKSEKLDVDAHSGDLAKPAGVPAQFSEHVGTMFDLQLLAMQADITRVASFMIGREVSNRTYPEIGVTDAHHMTSHHAGDPAKKQKVSLINRLHMQYFADYLGRLSATHDGAGSLLDSTLVMIGAGFGDPDIHDGRNLPMVLFGGGLKGNRHIQLAKNTPLSNLQRTVLQHMGMPVTRWANSTGVLDEVLA